MSEGEHLFAYPFRVTYKKCSDSLSPTAVVISVPKRNFKRAVWRNLLKRRSREAYRLNKSILPEGESYHILFVYVAKSELNYGSIEGGIREALTTISRR